MAKRTFHYRPDFTEMFDENGVNMGTFKQVLHKNVEVASEVILGGGQLLVLTDADASSGVSEVTNLTNLGLLSAASLDTGAFAYVDSLKSYFFLDKTSALTADGITIIAASGGGRWIRETWAHPYWETVVDWYIDPATGDDENSGAVGAPLATHGELARRWGTDPVLRQSTTVHIVGDLGQTDIVNIAVRIKAGATLTYQGATPTATYTGTIDGVTARDRATNQQWEIQDLGIPSWNDVEGERLALTSGASAGCVSWVDTDIGGGWANTGEWYDSGLGTYGTPQVGDDFEVQSLVTMNVGLIEVLPESDNTVDGTPLFIMSDIHVEAGVPGTRGFFQVYSRVSSLIYGCKFQLSPLMTSGGQVVVYNCFSSQGYGVVGGWLWNEAGITKGNYSAHASQAGSAIHLDGDIIVKGEGCWVAPGASVEVGAAAFIDNIPQSGFNEDGSGIFVESGGSFSMRYGVKGVRAIWGSSNTGYGLHAQPGAVVSLSGTTSVTGGSGDFRVGGTTTPRAWDEALGSYTNQRAATWANWATGVGAGGFGGNAHNVETKTSIVTEGY